MQGYCLAKFAFNYTAAMVQLLTLTNTSMHRMSPLLLPVRLSAHRQLSQAT